MMANATLWDLIWGDGHGHDGDHAPRWEGEDDGGSLGTDEAEDLRACEDAGHEDGGCEGYPHGPCGGICDCHQGADIPSDVELLRPEDEIAAAHERMWSQDEAHRERGEPVERPDIWHSPEVYDPGPGD